MRFDQHSVFSNRNKKTTHPYISFFFTNTTARLCQHTPHTPKQTTPKAWRQPQTHSKPLGYMGRAPFNEQEGRGEGTQHLVADHGLRTVPERRFGMGPVPCSPVPKHGRGWRQLRSTGCWLIIIRTFEETCLLVSCES